jgi:signal transduction histidine kinase
MMASPSVSTDDTESPAARGLRLDRPSIHVNGDAHVVVAPLRGWRRALGTIVVEGPSGVLDDEQLRDLLNEFSRQLSIGIENVQLLEDVMRQRRLLEDTFNSLVDLVLVTDNGFRPVQINDAFAERAGGDRAALLRRSLDDLVGSQMAAWIRDAGPASQARTHEFSGAPLGGTSVVTMTPLLTQDDQPIGRVIVVRDITAQVHLESEREALQGRLAQSEKLASLGQFVAGIAHEMNNPLQGVLGHLELLLNTARVDKPVRRELRRIYQDGDRAAKIVRNLLVFAGSQRMTRRRVNIDGVLSRAISSRAAGLRQASIPVARVQATGLPKISGDPLLLQQAFLNILINAEHAVEGREESLRLIDITTSFAQARRMVVVSIRDTGPGIPADVLPRIFDPFFTTKEVGKGTGLGLAIPYGIIQEHGGTIRAENAPEGGAVFTIELPAAE